MRAYITFDQERLKRAMLADLTDDELVRVRGMESSVLLGQVNTHSSVDFTLELSFREAES